MTAEVLLVLIALTALLTGGLAAYAWRHRQVQGARAYAALALAECLLCVAELLSMISPTPEAALAWFRLRYTAIAAVSVCWVVFVLQFSSRQESLPAWLIAALLVVPAATQALLWTNDQFGLWATREIGFQQYGRLWVSDTASRIPGPGFLVHSFYNLILSLAGVGLLLVTGWRLRRRVLGQALLLAGAGLTAFVFASNSIFNLIPTGGMNLFTPGIGLSVVLIALAAFRFGFLKRAPAAESGTRHYLLSPQAQRSLAAYLLVFAGMVAGGLAVGYLSYQAFAREHEAEAQEQLRAVARLKVDGLARWRAERLGDGQVLRRNAALAALVEAVLSDPPHEAARADLEAWLDSLRVAYGYERIFLLDRDGAERFTSPDTTGEPVALHLLPDLQAVLASGEPAFLDFHRDVEGGPVRLAVLVPFYDLVGGGPIGVLVLRIDPQTYLYPFLGEWPAVSDTAETLLVRRDGDEALFLNPVRYRPGAALTLRIPLEDTDVLAAKVVLGQTGVVDGIDYRGVAVIGDVEPVPDSPWFLVARQDLAEVHAPLTARLWQTVILLGALVIASAAGLWLTWRQQQLRHYRVRVEAAEALRASEDKFKYVFDNSATGNSITLPSGEVNVNQALCGMLGYSEDELKGRKWQDLTHPDDLELTQGVVDSLLAGERQSARFTKRYLHKDGSVVWADVGTALRRTPGGEPLYFLTSVTDITDRKRAEIELQALSARSQAILAAIPDIIMEVDTNKVYTWANRAGLEFFGDEVLGKEAATYFEGEQDTYAQVQPLFDGKDETYYVESWQRRQDGEKRLLGWWCHVLKDAAGNVVGALSSGRDITERKRADETLRESQARYRRLHESMTDCFVQTNMLGEIVDVNRSYLAMLGYAEDEVFKLRYQDLTPARWHAFEQQIVEAQIMPRGYSDVYEKEYIRKDGTVLPVELRAYLLRDTQGQPSGMWAVVRDITERKRWEDELRRMNAELEQGVAARTAQLEAANKELEAFAYSVSHDLRAPLRAMHGFSAALLSESRDQLDEQGRHYLDRIGAAAKHMGELVDALLELSRISRREMGHQPVDLSALAREVAAELQTQDRQRKVEWVVADDLMAQGDANLLSLALQNLMGNAWKFTGPRPQARIEVGVLPRASPASAAGLVTAEGERVYFVRDNGVGFDMAYADKLFSPFQRLHGTREFPGTGIGLATVQRIIARHGGRVWAEAKVDQGATFHFTLESA